MHPNLHVLIASAALLTAVATIPAQTCFFHPSDTPGTGLTSPQPFGNTDPADPLVANQRYQVQVPASVFGNQPRRICEIYVAPAGSRRRQFTEFQVRCGHNPNVLGPVLSTNTVGFTSSLVGTNLIERDTIADQWWPLGCVLPFDYDPQYGEMVVEISVRNGGAPTGTGDPGFRTDPSIPYAIAPGSSYRGTVIAGGGLKLRFCTEANELIEYGGVACVGSNGLTPHLSFSGSAQIGGPGFDVHLSDAVVRPNTAAALFWSFRLRSGPLDLSPAGMTGCGLYLFPTVVTTQFTSTGSAVESIRIPIGSTPCTRAWVQWFLLDPAANPLGIVGSNFGAITIGP